MLLYDGWRHEAIDSPEELSNAWIKGDMRIFEPYNEYLRDLVYGNEGDVGLSDSIFAVQLSPEGIKERVEDDLEINLEEDCPCLTENDSCNLAGCPCGTHATSLETRPSTVVEIDYSIMGVIETYVRERQQSGKRITVEQVLADRVAMKALRSMFSIGETSLVNTVTRKAERRIAEVRKDLQEMTAFRDRLAAHNLELQQSKVDENLRRQISVKDFEIQEQGKLVRRLQGWIDDLKSGKKQTPEFAKLTAKCKRLGEELRVRDNRIDELVKRVEKLGVELRQQKNAVALMQDSQVRWRREGFAKAVSAWQKALDAVKKEEGL